MSDDRQARSNDLALLASEAALLAEKAALESQNQALQEALALADAVVDGIATDSGQQVWFTGDHMALRIWDYQAARNALSPHPGD